MESVQKLYGGAVEIKSVFNNDRHEYYRRLVPEDGDEWTRVHGPTTALGILDKPMLIPWAAKMAVKDVGYYDKEEWTPDGYVPLPEEDQAKGYERMVSIHNRIKTMEPDEYWHMLKSAKGAHTRAKEAAGDNGTIVHNWVEAFCKGLNPEMPKLPKVRAGVEAWLRWVDKAGDITFPLSEAKIYSKKYDYAGTMDFTCVVNGVHTMGDLKTSNFFSETMFYQVSAYQLARQEEYPDEEYEQQIIVRCSKTGDLEVITSREYKEDIKAFLACLAIWRRQQDVKTKSKKSRVS